MGYSCVEAGTADEALTAARVGRPDVVVLDVMLGELLARLQRAIARSSSVRRPANGAAARLTARERDVLALLAQGLDTEAISERLYISPKTVGTHVQRILSKLDLHSRTAAVAFAYREGLVDEDEEVSAHASPGGLAVST